MDVCFPLPVELLNLVVLVPLFVFEVAQVNVNVHSLALDFERQVLRHLLHEDRGLARFYFVVFKYLRVALQV